MINKVIKWTLFFLLSAPPTYTHSLKTTTQISDKAEFEALMDAAAYKQHTEKA